MRAVRGCALEMLGKIREKQRIGTRVSNDKRRAIQHPRTALRNTTGTGDHTSKITA
jgi:hypothetical protein